MEALYNNTWHEKSADEDMKKATEWLQKTEQLEKQYHEELAAAGNDEQKKLEVVRRIGHGYDESSHSVHDKSVLYAR